MNLSTSWSFEDSFNETEDVSPDMSTPPQRMFEFALMLWISAFMFVLSGTFFFLSALPCRLTQRFYHSFDISGWSTLYFAFSVTLVVYNKWLISVWGFNFPLTITLIHMILKMILSWTVVRGCRGSEEIPLISNKVYILFALPVGATTALDVASSNASLFYVSVTLYTIVKSTCLLFVLLFSILYRLQPCDWKLFACTLVIFAGVILASVKNAAFAWIGFALVFISSALGGYRWALTEVLMKRTNSSKKMNALMTIYLISPASVLTMIPFFVWFELLPLWESEFYSDPALFLLAMANILFSGVFAFAMIYVELGVLNRTSSLSLVVIGYLKQILQIVLSAMLFHDVLVPINIAGIVVTFGGMVLYTLVKQKQQKQQQQSVADLVEKREEEAIVIKPPRGEEFYDVNLSANMDDDDVEQEPHSTTSTTTKKKKKQEYVQL